MSYLIQKQNYIYKRYRYISFCFYIGNSNQKRPMSRLRLLHCLQDHLAFSAHVSSQDAATKRFVRC